MQLRRGLCRSGFMPPLCFPGPGLICASPGSHFNLEPTCFKLLWLPVAPKVILVAVDLGHDGALAIPLLSAMPPTLGARRGGGVGVSTTAVITPRSHYARGSHLSPGSVTRIALYCPNRAQDLARSVQ